MALKLNNKFIIVTGGIGYIGSHIVKKLLEDEYNVISIDFKKENN